MLKGDISNEPALLCMVDYKILTEKKIRLSLKKGAEDWIRKNWGIRFGVFIVHSPGKLRFLLERRVRSLVRDFIPEVWFFDSKEEFRNWIQLNIDRVVRIYTNEQALLGIEDFIRPHKGWSEVL